MVHVFALHLHDFEQAGPYLQRRIRLAEELAMPGQLAGALNGLGVTYASTGAPSVGAVLYRAAANMARDHDVPVTQAVALMNLGTVQMSRDLDAAIDSYLQAREAARRAGSAPMIDWVEANYAATLLAAGRLRECAEVTQSAHETVTTPTPRTFLALVSVWVSEAMGTPVTIGTERGAQADAWERAATNLCEISRLLTSGDVEAAVALVRPAMAQTLEAAGLDDDFMHFWPPLVRVAVAAGETELAEELLEPVLSAPSGIISDAVAAHLLNLRGLVAGLRGDDPAEVEGSLRDGLAAMVAFGAVGWAARAEEDLGRWLVGQGRMGDASRSLEHAAQTYQEIGALGWLAELERWQSAHVPESVS